MKSVTGMALVGAAAFVVGLGVSQAIFGPGRGPQNDGNPVGFNLVTPSPSAANKQLAVVRTKPNTQCTKPNSRCLLEIHYLETPCPANIDCSQSLQCPAGAECIGFNGPAGIDHVDHTFEVTPHKRENLNVNGIVILRSPAP